MSSWNEDDLRLIAESHDLYIAPLREDGITYGTPTLVWPLVVDGEVYVRAAIGQQSGWYLAAMNQKAGAPPKALSATRSPPSSFRLGSGRIRLCPAHVTSMSDGPLELSAIPSGPLDRATVDRYAELGVDRLVLAPQPDADHAHGTSRFPPTAAGTTSTGSPSRSSRPVTGRTPRRTRTTFQRRCSVYRKGTSPVMYTRCPAGTRFPPR
jgi:hypothetical protein